MNSQPYYQGIPLTDKEARELIRRGEDLEFLPSNDHSDYCDCEDCI